MAERGLGRNKVLATVVHLLETTLIRVGNREYARDNKSYGLTTLQDRHVTFAGSTVRFKFRGKTGKEWRLKVSDRRVARIVRSCQELPGQHLVQYENDVSQVCQVSSADVNDYLREIGGSEITAKDFRTWAGTVLAAMALAEFEHFDSETAAKRNIRSAIETVASRLGNTNTLSNHRTLSFFPSCPHCVRTVGKKKPAAHFRNRSFSASSADCNKVTNSAAISSPDH